MAAYRIVSLSQWIVNKQIVIKYGTTGRISQPNDPDGITVFSMFDTVRFTTNYGWSVADGIYVTASYKRLTGHCITRIKQVDLAIGIDLGGTRIKGVLLNARSGVVIQQLITPTNDGDGSAWQTSVAQTVQALKAATTEPVLGVGLAAPGLPTANNTAINYMPGRLQGLEGFDWSAFLGEPVKVLNDAHAALLAEARFGVARGAKHVLMLTLGTGVGGGLLLNGQLYQGFMQRAGHMGHITLNADSEQAGITHTPGSLEDALGNTTVSRRSYGRYHTTHELIDAYRQGEPLATLVWLTSLRRLAVAIASLVNAFSPERVVLGGGIIQADDALFTPLQTFMDLFEWQPGGEKTMIYKAHFAEWAGAIGAAASLTD